MICLRFVCGTEVCWYDSIFISYEGCISTVESQGRFAMSELQKQMIDFSTMDIVSSVAESKKLSPCEAMDIVYKSDFF